MELSSRTYQAYVEILKRELVPAMGCTEPIAIAYCALSLIHISEPTRRS